jgi:hypothetical protein
MPLDPFRHDDPRKRLSDGDGLVLLLFVNDHAATPAMRAALELAPMLLLRPAELRFAQGSEFDLDAALRARGLPQDEVTSRAFRATARKMLQSWADCLDKLRRGAPVVQIGRRKQ